MTQPGAKHFHLIGVGGAGMSALAQLLVQRGQTVRGSDQQDSTTLKRLAQQGITTYVGHREENLDPAATVVYSSAIKENNPEFALARRRGQEIWHRSQALDWVCQGFQVVAVAGTHGKTTTATLIVQMLTALGMDVSFMIGSVLPGFNSGAHLAKDAQAGSVFVIEADESDGSFLNYHPTVAVITNIEADHLDHWSSQEQITQAFADFASLTGPQGAVVLCTDDTGSSAIAKTLPGSRQLRTYGFSLPSHGAKSGRTELFGKPDGGENSHILLSEPSFSPDLSQAQVQLWESAGTQNATLYLPLPGKHNLLNAAAALQVASFLGIDLERASAALHHAQGSARRMQLRGEVEGVMIYDDYAHHPTEVAAALAGARQKAGNARVLVLFQPHLYSRTTNFASQFAQALTGADMAVVSRVYAAREGHLPEVPGSIITDQMPASSGHYFPDPQAGAEFLLSQAQQGDVLVVMGAGDITQTATALVAGKISALKPRPTNTGKEPA